MVTWAIEVLEVRVWRWGGICRAGEADTMVARYKMEEWRRPDLPGGARWEPVVFLSPSRPSDRQACMGLASWRQHHFWSSVIVLSFCHFDAVLPVPPPNPCPRFIKRSDPRPTPKPRNSKFLDAPSHHSTTTLETSKRLCKGPHCAFIKPPRQIHLVSRFYQPPTPWPSRAFWAPRPCCGMASPWPTRWWARRQRGKTTLQTLPRDPGCAAGSCISLVQSSYLDTHRCSLLRIKIGRLTLPSIARHPSR